MLKTSTHTHTYSKSRKTMKIMRSYSSVDFRLIQNMGKIWPFFHWIEERNSKQRRKTNRKKERFFFQPKISNLRFSRTYESCMQFVCSALYHSKWNNISFSSLEKCVYRIHVYIYTQSSWNGTQSTHDNIKSQQAKPLVQTHRTTEPLNYSRLEKNPLLLILSTHRAHIECRSLLLLCKHPASIVFIAYDLPNNIKYVFISSTFRALPSCITLIAHSLIAG